MTRFLSTLAVLVVAIVAAAISWAHIEYLALTYGQPLVAARALPVSVDGAVVASSLALLDAARRGVQAPALARVVLVAGIVATLAANAVSGAGHGAIGVMVAMLSALSFIGSVEVLLATIRGRSQGVPEEATETAADAVPETAPASGSARTRSAPRSLSGSASRARRGTPARRDPVTVFAAELERGELPGVRSIKTRMHCGQDAATVIKGELAAFLSGPGETIEATA
jgi:hypothetical protein